MQIEFTQEATKLQQLIDALTLSISQGRYKVGDALPSINQMSNHNNLSRDTVFKAFQELKKRGLIDSTPNKGYYVNGSVNRVFMMLDSYTPFKDVLYNSVVENLPKDYTIDLLFHHYNFRVFESVILDSIGRYNMYVVMNFNNDKISNILKKIDSNKLLILDWGKYKDESYAYVCQDFGQALYDSLLSAHSLINKYHKMVMYLPDSSYHPRSSITYFKRFCEDHGIEHQVVKQIEEKNIEKHTAYLVMQQKELVEMIRYCRNRGLKIGKEAGLIVYNDMPLYDIIDDGITAISTDFALMGRLTAHFISSKQKIQEIIPTRLIVRGSL